MSRAAEQDEELLAYYAADLPDDATIVEIGTHRGEATIILAQSSPAHIYTIDHGGAALFGVGELTRVSPQEAAEKAKRLASFQRKYEQSLYSAFSEAGCENITFLFGSSHHEEWMDAVKWPYGNIDLLFIDGDHCYASIMADLIRWAPKVELYGYMILHDYVGGFKSVPIAVNDYFEAYPNEWEKLEQAGLSLACQRVREHKRQ